MLSQTKKKDKKLYNQNDNKIIYGMYQYKHKI